MEINGTGLCILLYFLITQFYTFKVHLHSVCIPGLVFLTGAADFSFLPYSPSSEDASTDFGEIPLYALGRPPLCKSHLAQVLSKEQPSKQQESG